MSTFFTRLRLAENRLEGWATAAPVDGHDELFAALDQLIDRQGPRGPRLERWMVELTGKLRGSDHDAVARAVATVGKQLLGMPAAAWKLTSLASQVACPRVGLNRWADQLAALGGPQRPRWLAAVHDAQRHQVRQLAQATLGRRSWAAWGTAVRMPSGRERQRSWVKGARWSGGLGESDGVAEGFELADVASHFAVRVDLAGVVAGAEILVAGSAVGEQVPVA